MSILSPTTDVGTNLARYFETTSWDWNAFFLNCPLFQPNNVLIGNYLQIFPYPAYFHSKLETTIMGGGTGCDAMYLTA